MDCGRMGAYKIFEFIMASLNKKSLKPLGNPVFIDASQKKSISSKSKVNSASKDKSTLISKKTKLKTPQSKVVDSSSTLDSSSKKPSTERKIRQGLRFSYSEINDLYTKTRKKVTELMGDKVFRVESIPASVGQDAIEILEWCGTWRFEASPGKAWKLYYRDFEKGVWVQTTNGKKMGFPHYSLLPIVGEARLNSQLNSYHLMSSSLQRVLEASGYLSLKYKAEEIFINQLLLKHGFHQPSPDLVDIPLELEACAVTKQNPAEEVLMSKWQEEYQKISSMLTVTRKILVQKIAGKVPVKGDALHAVEKAKRGLGRQFWKMIDKDLLGVMVRMYWREPVSLEHWLEVSQHREELLSIAETHRSLLPLLPKINQKYWKKSILTSPQRLGEILFEDQESLMWGVEIVNYSKAEKTEKATQILANPFSVNFHLSRAGFQSYNRHLLEWDKSWEKYGLPIWVRQTLLKSSVKLITEETKKGTLGGVYSNETQPLTFRTEAWMKEWCEAAVNMLDHYRSTQGFRAVQTVKHDFWQEIYDTFNRREEDVWSLAFNSSNGPVEKKEWNLQAENFRDSLPFNHPWSPILAKIHLEGSLEKAEEVPIFKRPIRRI